MSDLERRIELAARVGKLEGAIMMIEEALRWEDPALGSAQRLALAEHLRRVIDGRS